MADVGCAGILVADTFCGPLKQLPAEGQLLAVDSMPSAISAYEFPTTPTEILTNAKTRLMAIALPTTSSPARAFCMA